MSLNGLDSPEVAQALASATTEPAAWLLLKYTSRDTVNVLGNGTGGVSDARSCLLAYNEASPVYGLINFRRKRVLIKYIPEDTSRLLQVRTAVHFQDVIDAFAPHDTILDITAPDGLNDTALAAAFPTYANNTVHGALDEIAEGVEESTASTHQRQASSTSTTSKLSRKAALDRVTALRGMAPKSPTPSSDTPGRSSIERSPGTLSLTESLSSPPPMSARTPQQANYEDSIRPLSATTDFYNDSSRDLDIYDYKPKVKLAPRQVQIGERRRASQMPASIRRPAPSSNTPAANNAPSASQLNGPASPMNSPTLPEPPAVSRHPLELSPRATSSMSNRPPSTFSTRSKMSRNAMTPGKQRLMKAMELRKQRHERSQTPTNVGEDSALDLASSSSQQSVDQSAPESSPATEGNGLKDATSLLSPTKEEDQSSDSGIEINQQPHTDDAPEASRSTPNPTVAVDETNLASHNEDKVLPHDTETSPAVNGTVPLANKNEIANMLDEFPVARSDTPREHSAAPSAASKDNRPKSPPDVEPGSVSFFVDTNSPRAASPVSKPKSWFSDGSESSKRNTKSSEDLQAVSEDFHTPERSPIDTTFEGKSPTSVTSLDSPERVTVHEATTVAVMRLSASSADVLRSRPVSQDAATKLRATPSRPQSDSSPMSVDDLLAASMRNQIGSGISQRIAALAQSQSRELSPNLSPMSTSTRKSDSPLSPRSLSGSYFQDQQAAILRERLKVFAKGPNQRSSLSSKRQSHSSYTVDEDPATKTESVSVTAKIVRPTSEEEDSQTTLGPEVTIDSAPAEPMSHDAASPSTTRRPSANSIRSTDSSRFKRFSLHASRPASIKSGSPSLRPPSPANEGRSSSPPKSRTSRFFKRMSGLSRKRTTKESRPTSVVASPADSHSGPVQIGNVNVQFPNTPLWKRRHASLDTEGSLSFRAPEGGAGVPVRSFDLRGMAGVHVPRPDERELAHSVVLSLADAGGTLTIACEDAAGQGLLLELLVRQLEMWSG